MQLVMLRFIKCRRFKFSLHDTITYSPNAIEQVILGTNGCGKSFMLGQIYNVVPTGDMFFTGGGQEHYCIHKGRHFRAISMFPNKAGHHSFCISYDGEQWEELNESGLQTDQRMLVKLHLGLDQDLIELASGISRLSKMDATTRRKWMMRICGTDFDYINQLHQVLKKRHRDFKGTIDTLTEALVDTIKDIEAIAVDVNENSKEFDDLQQLTTNISHQLEMVGSVNASVGDLRESIEDTVRELKDLSHAAVKLYASRVPSLRYLAADKVAHLRNLVELDNSSFTGQQKIIHERLRDILMAIDAIGKENLKEPTLVFERLDAIGAEMSRLEAVNGIPEVDLFTIGKQINDTDVSIRRLEPILSEVPHIEDLRGLKETVQANRGKVEVIEKKLFEINNMVEKYESRLTHYSHSDDVDCPSCHLKFKPGFDPNMVGSYTRKLERLNAEKSELTKELTAINESLELYDTLTTLYRQFGDVVNQHSSIQAEWDKLIEEKLFFKFPALILTHLSTLLKRLEAHQEYLKLKAEQDRLISIKASLEGDTGHLLETAERLEGELFDLNMKVLEGNSQIKQMENDISLANSCYQTIEKFNHRFGIYSGLLERLHKATILQHLHAARITVTTRIGTLHALRSKYTNLIDRQEVLKEQIDASKTKFEIYKILDKATSPTEGIPADILRSFMEHFLSHMNGHLARVWSYSLELMGTPTNGNLTCQFPMLVAGDDEPVPDFKMGSTGQVSMVDFAFKLVVFAFEGLNDYPLLADEFGKDFDDEHREQLIHYIKQMIESKTYSQLFMVSHYSSVYSAFDNAEIAVLSDRNITKPAEYNTSLEFG